MAYTRVQFLAQVLCVALTPTLLGDRALAQVVFVGPEFQVNTYTTGHQLAPSVSADGSGNFVVTWESGSQDGSTRDVFAQRFSSSGTPLGGEFQVNTYTTDWQWLAEVAVHTNGSFVVVWTSSAGAKDIFAQRFDSLGTPQGGEFQVNTYTPGQQVPTSVGSDASGNFVVVWHGIAPGAAYCCEVLGRRFNSMGNPQGDEFQVNTYTTDLQLSPRVAVKASGDFVVVWASDGQGVAGRRFDSMGTPQGGEFVAASESERAFAGVEVDTAGNFVVVWRAPDSDGIYVRRFDSSGTPQGLEHQIGTDATGDPAISADGSGNFVVAWSGGDGDDDGVFGRVLDSSGAPVGSEFQINTFTTGQQSIPSVAATGPGNFVVTWRSGPVLVYGTCGGGTCVGQFGCFGDLGDAQCAFLCGGTCNQPPPPPPGQDGDSFGVIARRLMLCTCTNGDGCCGPGCNSSNDDDCVPTLPSSSRTGWWLLVCASALSMVWALRGKRAAR